MLRHLARVVPRFARNNAARADVIDEVATTAKVTDQITGVLSDASKRLFAIVYVNGRQWKVSQGDLISLEGNMPLAVGDQIKLEKVLMVGGEDFSVFGRPLIDTNSVDVRATVVEKNAKFPELKYFHNNHTQDKSMHWLTRETTVLRINNVTAKSSITGPPAEK